jgi:hypothetical protein
MVKGDAAGIVGARQPKRRALLGATSVDDVHALVRPSRFAPGHAAPAGAEGRWFDVRQPRLACTQRNLTEIIGDDQS